MRNEEFFLEFIENKLTKEVYLSLRKQVGWKLLSSNQAVKAIQCSLYTVCVYENGNPVGMGRVIGDGAVICYIQDLLVIPEARNRQIGSEILRMLKEYVENLMEENTSMMLCLMSAKGREEFYIRNGFNSRPNDNLGPGMITFLQK